MSGSTIEKRRGNVKQSGKRRELVAPDRMAVRVGIGAAVVAIALGVVYLAIIGIMIVTGMGFPPTLPYQYAAGAVTLMSAPTLVVFMLAIHFVTGSDRKIFSATSVLFTVLFAVMTSINRFVQLTVVRESLATGKTQGLDLFMPYGWPSVMLALEVLGWGGFLGLALVFMAFVFQGGTLERWLFWTFLISGAICLLTVLGMLFGFQALLSLGPAAWGGGLSLASVLALIWFRRMERG